MSFPSPIGRSGPGPTLGDPDAKEDPKKREPGDDAWTLAITQALVEVRPRLALPSDAEPGARDANPGAERGAELAQASGELGSGDASATEDARPGPALPARLHTELSDSKLGRMQLSVARGPSGLHIVINVADSRVKALIEAERSSLLKSLQDCGLRVDSVEIGSEPLAGTAFAQQEVAPERALARTRGNSGLRSPTARWRAYTSPPEEDPDSDNERVDLTA